MKKYFLSILFSFAVSSYITLFAQANLRCTYMENYKRYADSDKVDSDEMILEISRQSSEYYSLWNRKRQAVVDSMSAKGASLEEVLTAREKLGYPRSPQYFTVYKNYPEKGELLYIDRMFGDYYQYAEKMIMPQWDVRMEKKEIPDMYVKKQQPII